MCWQYVFCISKLPFRMLKMHLTHAYIGSSSRTQPIANIGSNNKHVSARAHIECVHTPTKGKKTYMVCYKTLDRSWVSGKIDKVAPLCNRWAGARCILALISAALILVTHNL